MESPRVPDTQAFSKLLLSKSRSDLCCSLPVDFACLEGNIPKQLFLPVVAPCSLRNAVERPTVQTFSIDNHVSLLSLPTIARVFRTLRDDES